MSPVTGTANKKERKTVVAMRRKILITGGSRGIGAACVRRFAGDGCDVAAVYRSSDEAARRTYEDIKKAVGKTDASLIFIRADVSDPAEARRAFAEAESALGHIDVLVNCAGIASIKLFTDITDDEWKHMIDTNLSSAFYLSRAAASGMIRRHYGRIINIGSVWGRLGASCEVHYSASKAGLRGLTQALAKELGPSGITVNCIEPGVIDTDMNAALSPEVIAELCDSTPLCRIGTPDEVAAAAAFLASDDASFITGAFLPVDGGFPA